MQPKDKRCRSSSVVRTKRWLARIRRRHTLASMQAEKERKNSMVHDYERLYHVIEEEVYISIVSYLLTFRSSDLLDCYVAHLRGWIARLYLLRGRLPCCARRFECLVRAVQRFDTNLDKVRACNARCAVGSNPHGPAVQTRYPTTNIKQKRDGHRFGHSQSYLWRSLSWLPCSICTFFLSATHHHVYRALSYTIVTIIILYRLINFKNILHTLFA